MVKKHSRGHVTQQQNEEALPFPSDLVWILCVHKPKQMEGERTFLQMNDSIANCACEKGNTFTLTRLKIFLNTVS